MKLSPKQIEYINKEREILIRLIKAKEKNKVDAGIWGDRIRLQMIQLIIELHNLEIQPNIDLHNLEIGKKDETQNHKPCGESTPDSCM